MWIFNKGKEEFAILNNQTGKKNPLDFGVICNFADILPAYDNNNVMQTTLQYIEAKKNNNEKEYLKKITEAEFVKYFNKEWKSIEHTDKVRDLVYCASSILSQLSKAYTRHKCFNEFIHSNVQQQYIQETLDKLEKGNKDPRKYLESFLDAQDIIGKETIDTGISTYKEHYKTSIKEFIISGDKSDISMLFYNRISGRPDEPYKLLTQEELQAAIMYGFNERYHNKIESRIATLDESWEDTLLSANQYGKKVTDRVEEICDEIKPEIDTFNHIQDSKSAIEIQKALRIRLSSFISLFKESMQDVIRQDNLDEMLNNFYANRNRIKQGKGNRWL